MSNANAAPESIKSVRKSDSFASYYSNDTQVQTGPWDVRLIFGVIDEASAEKGIEVVQVAEVRMSPQHALQIHKILGDQLRRYAASFGEIPNPTLVDKLVD